MYYVMEMEEQARMLSMIVLDDMIWIQMKSRYELNKPEDGMQG